MDNLVITIGRQYGSGGRKIGMLLAGMLGIAFWDRKLITEAARRSGLHHDFFKDEEERQPGLLRQVFSPGWGFSPGFGREAVVKIQSDTIVEVAQKEPCVIVGRMADYVLRENPNCINIFVAAPLADRVRRVASRHSISQEEAADMIAKMDKRRAAYYDFYTDKRWGDSGSYHLCIDSSILGLERSAEIVRQFIAASGKGR